MATSTQYNPNEDLNAFLLAQGLSKTVYALVTPETEELRKQIQAGDYLDQFRDAWTGKQDVYHEEFFNKWCEWSSPVVDLSREEFPFYYPTAGASEPLRQIIFNLAARSENISPLCVHFFAGEYEGYRAMAEAAGLQCIEHDRDWNLNRVENMMSEGDLFFISQPAAIDGNVWNEFNEFVSKMRPNSVIADITYVGAVPKRAIKERFDLNQPAIHSIVFSLSKPFGAYYDRIGGCFTRAEDPALFGNRWFKNLTSIRYGTALMDNLSVFALPERYRLVQERAVLRSSDMMWARTGNLFFPSDVYILGNTKEVKSDDLSVYLRRGGTTRVCLTPAMAKEIGTSGAAK